MLRYHQIYSPSFDISFLTHADCRVYFVATAFLAAVVAVVAFLAVFFLVFFAFVQVFYMILHAYMPEFQSIIASLETCFTMVLNKFKFGRIRDASLTAAIMFFCFAISCSFILINVMLTIIMEAYEEVSNNGDGHL